MRNEIQVKIKLNQICLQFMNIYQTQYVTKTENKFENE